MYAIAALWLVPELDLTSTSPPPPTSPPHGCTTFELLRTRPANQPKHSGHKSRNRNPSNQRTERSFGQKTKMAIVYLCVHFFFRVLRPHTCSPHVVPVCVWHPFDSVSVRRNVRLLIITDHNYLIFSVPDSSRLWILSARADTQTRVLVCVPWWWCLLFADGGGGVHVTSILTRRIARRPQSCYEWQAARATATTAAAERSAI